MRNQTELCMSSIFFLLSLFCGSSRSYPAEGEIMWEKTFSGSAGAIGFCIQQTSDGGYVVAGTTTTSMKSGTVLTIEQGVWVLKLNPSGMLEWDRTLGTKAEGRFIHQTLDGGYIVAGDTSSKGAGKNDVWILRLDSSGRLVWDKTFGGSSWDEPHSIQETSDGGYIVAGITVQKGVDKCDAWVLNLDSSGRLLWDRAFGGSEDDFARSIQQTSDGGYVVAGETYSKGAGRSDVWVLRIDSVGKLSWERTFGGNGDDVAFDIQQTSDGGYIVAGNTSSKGAGELDAWVLKLDSVGNLLWEKTFGGSKSDEARSIQQTSDGGYIVAGNTSSKGAGEIDAWVLKLDSVGNLLWEKTFGGRGADSASSICQTADGDYVFAGWTLSGRAGVWVLKLTGKRRNLPQAD